MKYKPNDTIFTIQAQAHTSVLRTIHGKNRSRSCITNPFTQIGAVILPLLVTSNVLLWQSRSFSLTSSHEIVHGAAPNLVDEIETRQDMEEVYCSSLCLDPTSDLMRDFCIEICKLPLVEEIEIQTIDIPTAQAEIERNTSAEYIPITPEPEIIRERLDTPSNHKAMYLTPNSAANAETVQGTMQSTISNMGNALVVDVKGSFVYFATDAALANELGLVRPIVDLSALVEEAHKNGMYVIGRYIAMKDPSLATKVPETQIKNTYTGRGIGSVWVTPNHPITLEYNRQILSDLIDTGIDEINFDYIRYPTEYNQAAINLSGEEKAEQLLEFLQMARNLVHEKQATTKLGASTYAILGWNFPVNFEPLGQDIPRYAEILDVISPMAYPSTFAAGSYYDPAVHRGSRNYYLVHKTLLGYQELMGKNAWKLRPWIQGYYMTQKALEDEMQAVYDANVCGFMVWSAQNYYDEAYKALKRTALNMPSSCDVSTELH